MNNETISTKKGGTKPLVHLLPMMALLVFGMIALVGVVSADDAYRGLAPETVANGVVNGGVNVLYSNTWSTTNLTTDTASVNFNLSEDTSFDRSTDELEFARLYVVVYSGNMTANYEGTEDITLSNVGGSTATLADDQWLNLNYDGTQIVYNNSVSKPPFVSLSRVTSDYLNIFDVKNNITSNNIVVNVSSTYQSGKYDGRIKEVKLVYGWNETSSDREINYWVNEGHDPVTKYDTLGGNTTWFNGTGNPASYTANLWIDYLAGADGNYTWNNEDITPTVIEQGGSYSGFSHLSWTQNDEPPEVNEDNSLKYDRANNNWYKIILAVFTLE
jgi:hypothetical protein